MAKGYVTETMGSNRIVSHGQINGLRSAFSLAPLNVPFSIYIRPRNGGSETDIIAEVKCYQDDIAESAPITLNEWSPLLISSIKANVRADDYDVFWGAGQYVNKLEVDYYRNALLSDVFQQLENRPEGMSIEAALREVKELVSEELIEEGFSEKQIKEFWDKFNLNSLPSTPPQEEVG